MTDQHVTLDGLRCTTCGAPMPPIAMDAAASALVRSRGATLLCGACSGLPIESAAGRPAGRHFVLAVELLEVYEPTDGARDGSRERLLSFRASATAPTLDAAMPALAERFGEQWMRAQASSHIADSVAD